MRIDWAVPYRYAEAAADGTMSILGGGLDTFWIADDALPAPIGVFIATRVVGGEEEWAAPHPLAVCLLRPDLEEEVMLEAPLQIEMPPLKQPGHEAGALFPLILQWEAREFGLYSFEFFLDGDRAKSVPINVRAQSEVPQPPPQP